MAVMSRTVVSAGFALATSFTLVFAGCGVQLGESGLLDENEHANRDQLLDKDMGVNAFYELALKKAPPGEKRIDKSPGGKSLVGSCEIIEVYLGDPKESDWRDSFKVVSSTGEVLSYHPLGVGRPKFDETSAQSLQFISEGEAFEKAKPVLNFYGFPIGLAEYSSHFEENKRRSYWAFTKKFEKGGIPYRGAFFTISIWALTGDIKFTSYHPPVLPGTHDVVISKEEALEIAKKFIDSDEYFASGTGRAAEIEASTDDVIEIIGAPNNEYKLGGEELHPTETYYCWEVPLRYRIREGWIEGAIWVNNSTGEVIGGCTL